MATAASLTLPFRRTQSTSISSAIKRYISTKYDQHPDMFLDDLKAIDKLRADAVTVLEPQTSGIQKIEAYAAQLVWLGGKFPIDIGADFTWYPSVSTNGVPVSQNNIRFELANILFNLAVLYWQLAMNTNRSNAEGLKTASNYYSVAAGVISHLKSSILSDLQSAPPEDMDPMTMECLEQLLLAFAQECFWQKAVKDCMSDALIAKISAKVSDFYLAASDWAVKSDVVSSEWIHHMSAKHHHFAAAAQYRAGADCLEKRKYGEEVSRLRDCVACCKEGLKEARYIHLATAEDLRGLQQRASDALQRAEQDNDLIYLLPTPSKSELKIIERLALVSPKITNSLSDPVSLLGDRGPLGKLLFTKLVPYSVHVAASIYDNRRDQVIAGVIEELEALNSRVHDLLRSLNLPGSLQALEKPLGLPPGLESHAEEIRQQDGPNRLQKALIDIKKLRTADYEIFQEGVKILNAEAAEDDAARRKYGTDRWKRLGSSEAAVAFQAQIKEYEGYFKTAASSDAAIKERIKTNEGLIGRLNGTDRELEDFVPSSGRVTPSPQVERESRRVREALNEVSRLQKRRTRTIESLRTKAQSDDVHPAIIKEAHRLERESPMVKLEAVQFEDFFDRRLERYNEDVAIPSVQEREQTSLLSLLSDANTALTSARKGDSSTKDREKALQKLENAYYSYKELIQNLDAARKFYNNLAPLVSTFRNDCRHFAYQRRGEATNIENDINMSLPMSTLSVTASPTESTGPQSPRRTWTQNQNHLYRDSGPRTESPLAAPQPVKPQQPPAAVMEAQTVPSAGVWNPDAGIKFARGQGAANEGGATDGRWDASRGIQFGS